MALSPVPAGLLAEPSIHFTAGSERREDAALTLRRNGLAAFGKVFLTGPGLSLYYTFVSRPKESTMARVSATQVPVDQLIGRRVYFPQEWAERGWTSGIVVGPAETLPGSPPEVMVRLEQGKPVM